MQELQKERPNRIQMRKMKQKMTLLILNFLLKTSLIAASLGSQKPSKRKASVLQNTDASKKMLGSPNPQKQELMKDMSKIIKQQIEKSLSPFQKHLERNFGLMVADEQVKILMTNLIFHY